MSIHKFYATQIFQQRLDQYPPDPHPEGEKEERRKLPVPPGLSKRDREILLSVRKGYHFLEETFHIGGIYFGWSFIFAFFVPVVGPMVDYLLSYDLIIRKAEKADLPPWVQSEMMHNLLLGIALSFIPFAGRIISALFGFNSRNELLFEELLRIRSDEYLRLGGDGVLLEEKSDGDTWWKVLSGKAGGSTGVSKKDAEQIKPGAGMTTEEVRQPLDIGASGAGTAENV